MNVCACIQMATEVLPVLLPGVRARQCLTSLSSCATLAAATTWPVFASLAPLASLYASCTFSAAAAEAASQCPALSDTMWLSSWSAAAYARWAAFRAPACELFALFMCSCTLQGRHNRVWVQGLIALRHTAALDVKHNHQINL